MNAVCSDCERNVRTAIDEQPCSRRVFAHGVQRLARKLLKWPRRKVLFPQLNVINSCARTRGDPLKERYPLPGIGTLEAAAIGNVIKKH